MKKITVTTTAWLTKYGDPESLFRKDCASIDGLAFSKNDMTSCGWSKVGPAKITVEVPDMDALVTYKIEALRAEVKSIRADAEVRAGDIEEKIQKLLAITYEVPA